MVTSDQYSKFVGGKVTRGTVRSRRRDGALCADPLARLEMFTRLLRWATVAAVLGSLFQCSSRGSVALLFGMWVVVIAMFGYLDMTDRFIWVPALLGVGGVFGTVIALAVPGKIPLAANVAVLLSFVISLEVLMKKRRSSPVVIKGKA
jgi:hypothetical protein